VSERMVLKASSDWTASFLMCLGCEAFQPMFRRTFKSRELYQGRRVPILFDPATKDIFRLNLMPGDELVW
jgi:hypothetical protein